jgi:hypothetical protein
MVSATCRCYPNQGRAPGNASLYRPVHRRGAMAKPNGRLGPVILWAGASTSSHRIHHRPTIRRSPQGA